MADAEFKGQDYERSLTGAASKVAEFEDTDRGALRRFQHILHATPSLVPLIVLTISIMVGVFMLVFVVPQVAEAMQSAMGKDKQLPAATRMLADLGLFIRGNPLVIAGSILAVVVAIVAYLARASTPAGSDFLHVLQIVGTTSWLAYAWQGPADSIWKGRPWGSTMRTIVEGLLYAVVTGAIFAWQWPAA